MLNTRLQRKMEEEADSLTSGTETLDEAKDILRVLGIKFSNQREDQIDV